MLFKPTFKKIKMKRLKKSKRKKLSKNPEQPQLLTKNQNLGWIKLTL